MSFERRSSDWPRAFPIEEAPAPAAAQVWEQRDRWAVRALIAWSILVLAVVVAPLLLRQAATLSYPIGRILFEDQFNNLGRDGRVLPREGETIPPAFAVIFMAPVFWVHQMIYFPLADLLGSIQSITIARLFVMVLYQVGTPMVYRLLRYGGADRWVAVTFAMIYSVSPFTLTRMLACNSLPTAQFMLWSELGRIRQRPYVRAIGLIAATFSYPLAGFCAVILAFQDYYRSAGQQRRTNLWILLATASALAMVHFGVLVLWPIAQPSLTAQNVTLDDNLRYPVFPYRLPLLLATPVKLFEIAVFIASCCVFLLTHPSALLPAIVDIAYYAGTNKGIRDHSMNLTSIALFFILGVRNGLFKRGSLRNNRILVGSALAATAYGFVMAGQNGLITLALAPDPPRPHLEDIAPCVPPGSKRCLVSTALYAGFYRHCEQVDVYEPPDLENLHIDERDTIVFVAPGRLGQTRKGRPYATPEAIQGMLDGLARKIRSGELHATACEPGLVLVRAPDGTPNDAAVADLLKYPPP
jgi:hypothetical protein